MRTPLALSMCAVLTACGGAYSTPPTDVACSTPAGASPPSATTPTGPTAVNPPSGYPAIMNPTAPMAVAATPALGVAGTRTSSASNTTGAAREECARLPAAAVPR